MPALGIVGLVLLVVLALLALAPRAFAGEAAPAPPPPGLAAKEPAPIAPLTRAELAQRLQKLTETPAPKDVGPGATCYRRAAPPTTAEYVCPKDGSHTHYSKNSVLTAEVRDVPYLRDQATRLPGVEASIDESEFCRKCTPSAPATPRATLVVRLKDGGEKRTRAVTSTDLSILREFLIGKLSHDDQGGGTPLKSHLPRIRELLGMDEKPNLTK
jgi:hypothetical protein